MLIRHFEVYDNLEIVMCSDYSTYLCVVNHYNHFHDPALTSPGLGLGLPFL